MRSKHAVLVCLAALLATGLSGIAAARMMSDEKERKVTEREVPKVAMDALRKVAGGAAFTELAEESEHGCTYYEGSWKGEHGETDALVTASGDLVEIEEHVPADKVPAAVRAAAKKDAESADTRFERKTVIMYEYKFKKGDRWHEVSVTPDGRQTEREENEKDEGD